MWNRIIGIVGPKGSGKSYMAADIMSKAERAAVYQIVREDSNYLRAATDIVDGDIKQFCLALVENDFRLIYKVAEGAKKIEGNKIVLPDFTQFIECCFTRRNMMMIIDEAHFLCSPRFIPASFWESIVTGRHVYLDIVFVTQRFSMVHRDLTANTQEFIFWNITEPSDLDSIEERCGEEVRNKVQSLRPAIDNRAQGGNFVPGEYYQWKTGGNKNGS
jgi:Zonular occludens toxin (Zot)